MPSSKCSTLALGISIATLLQIAGVSLFLFGFFPVKPTLSGFSGSESYQMPSCDSDSDAEMVDLSSEQRKSLYEELSGIPPVYDRLILMVIDGLPAEFILGKGRKPPAKTMAEAMPYTQYLLANELAVGFHAKAAPPTVTMPRLKAMMSGGIGGFLDVAFNFNTQAFLDDNLLDQLYRIGWRMVMLGDNTWIKLFPNLFSRQDGVGSFFVKDTVEVDLNVSRHLDVELAAEDWNLLILHYLGLDHVGHIGGRQSILMAPKLKEMDDIIKEIHMQSITSQKNSNSQTLLVVVSDHGMTEAGNHGGSSYEETDSLALFVGHGIRTASDGKKVNNEAFQVDIAPTLALLFGVPIPKNNIGVTLTNIFQSLTEEQRLRALELNSWQLLRLLRANLPQLCCDYSSSSTSNFNSGTLLRADSTGINFCIQLAKAVSAHDSWRLQNNSTLRSDYFHIASESYELFLRNASEWLSHRATDKPIHILLVAVVLMFISCLLFVCLAFWLFFNTYNNLWTSEDTFIFIAVILHAMSFGSSSFVEEEQYTWHFLTTTLYLIFLFTQIRTFLKGLNGNLSEVVSPIILVLISGRILRGWHQGGINWAHLPDISKLLLWLSPSTITFLHITSILSLSVLYSNSISILKSQFNLVLWLSYLIGACLVLLQSIKNNIANTILVDHGTTWIPQAVYVIGGISVISSLFGLPWFSSIRSKKGIFLGIRECIYDIGSSYVAFWCLLQLLLQQPVNAIPVLLIYMQHRASVSLFADSVSEHKDWVKVAAMYFLGLAGHFGLGNTNSLATIDVAGAFIGISSYSTVLSGILMFCITYASPILSHLSMVMCISTMVDRRVISSKEKFNWRILLESTVAIPSLVPLVVNSVALTSFTVVLLLMRNHLFVWSVFSPKYLYLCASTVSVYLGVLLIAGTVFYICYVFTIDKRKYQT
ncbi:GPI ethanolamine phosphate transferase 2 [Rhynchospora pubera]|uniref:GPI ethanolamine phosphate transferase 2 n=1 Tax=Rhynchospora pubera TaxID=906938 RepID=A0AAV8HE08_9POAL|nr:GPI ethanolamine phosphate transferase 2 [Rhynchospora pubera]